MIRCASVRGNAGRAISWPAFLYPVVIVLRAHWTLDVLAGLFAALMVGAVFWPG
jgi:hypothetical protein